ncbi:MAG: hypothetical protein KTR21_11095 [Rhodobacteraceae bacterium]|nr:hypothetical protein [Paracoccaceae bacterium]
MSSLSITASFFAMARDARADKQAADFGFWLAVAIAVAGVFDVISTDLALSTGAQEANPIIRQLQTWLGAAWLAPKLMLHVLLGYMVMWFPNRPTLIMMTVVCGLIFLAAFNNFGIYFQAVGGV